jgi:uncharacterized protein
MARKIFVNIPVKNLKRAAEFFTGLGFSFDPKFTDENATCMIINDDAFVMLLAEEYFKTFTKKPTSDATKQTEVLLAVSCDSRSAVDTLADKALATGGKAAKETQDLGFMYLRTFYDLDGHHWEVAWMDPNGMPQQ